MSVRIVLADNRIMILEGLHLLLGKHPEMEVVGEARNMQKAVQLTRELSPDVAILGVSVPIPSCIQATRQIAADDPAANVVALSMYSHQQYVAAMLRAGARGYVLFDSAFGELVQCIEMVTRKQRYVSPAISTRLLQGLLTEGPSNGPSVLSRRELEVFLLLAQGGSIEEIASALRVSQATLKNHRQQVMRKLGLHSAAELVRYAFLEGMV